MRTADILLYVTDNARVTAATGWTPRRMPEQILRDLHAWMVGHAAALDAVGL